MTYRDQPSLDDGSLDEKDHLIPNAFRLVAAFVAAPTVAASALAVVQPGYFGLPYIEAVYRTAVSYALFGAYPLTIIFAVPAYFILRKRVRAKIVNCALTGAIIAALPWFFIGAFGRTGNAWTNDRPTLIDGQLTAYGWAELALIMLLIGAAGAIAGAVFWLVAVGGKQTRREAG